jgi:hypothetical protein
VRASDGLRVDFVEAVRAVVPGQFAVFMKGERVLGGGVIRARILAEASARGLPLAVAAVEGGAP